MRLTLTTLVFLLAYLSVVAQEPLHKTYDWADKPVLHSIAPSAASYSSVVVKHSKLSELRLDMGNALTYVTEHKIVHVNSDAGIEQFNKVYIPVLGENELVSFKVRAISPGGQVTNFKKENLKELQNLQGYGNFKIFAVEGLTVGGEMEYLYTVKSNPQTYGREVFQRDIPVMEANLEVVFPDRFRFAAKSYNGFPQPREKELDTRRRVITAYAKDIPALEEEEYSAYKANLMRVDYKLESNGSTTGMTSWETIAGQFLKTVYDPKGTAKVAKMLKPLKLEEKRPLEKIRAVEAYVKTNFTIKEGNNDSYEDVKEVISTRVGNERGMTKLFLSCWEALEIESDMVFACERTDGMIDPAFASVRDIDKVLFYFPAEKSYLVPSEFYYRLGAAPNDVEGSNGVFISYEPSAVTGLKVGSVEVRKIDALDYTHNKLGVKAVVSFNEKIEAPLIIQENYWQGSRATLYRGYHHGFPEDRREEFYKDVTVSGIENYVLVKRELEGQDVNLSADADSFFKIKTTYKAPTIVEKAGDDYLIAIGKIIGKQSELYQEKERAKDVSFHSISNYQHEIVVEIPPGYECSGVESAKIDNAVMLGNDKVMYFQSDYVLDGNRLVIKVNEVYKTFELPKAKYADFRAVVNSAADFSKLVIVLHKK